MMEAETFWDSDPTRLTYDQAADPFSYVEMFFLIMGLAGWKRELESWLRRALTTNYIHYEYPGRFVFYVERLNNLLEAGLMISQHRLTYKPIKTNKYTSGEWLKKRQKTHIREGTYYLNEYQIQLLEPNQIENPLAFIYEFLQFENVKRMRQILHDWMHSALHMGAVWQLDDEGDIWKDYEDLKRMIEAFYLILTEYAPIAESSNDKINTKNDASIDPEAMPNNI